MSGTASGRPRRIAYLHQYFATPRMPGGTRSYEMARRLVRDGHEVHVITTDTAAPRPSWRWRTSVEEGVHVHWLPVPYGNSMSHPRRVLAFARFALAATARAVAVAPDVVFATSTPLTVAVPGVVAARLRRVRFVFEVRDLWPELPIEVGALRHPVAKAAARWLARTAYRNADRVVALSEGMAVGVARYGYPRERVSVVPNGCDLEAFDVPATAAAQFRAARPWLQDRPLVVYAGTFGKVNGVGWLVRLAAEVARLDPEVRFLLIGEGREHAEVEQLARRTGVLGRSLFMVPEVAKDEVPPVLAAATVATSVFVTAGMRDNSANKFFDALAAGRPVAINHGGWQAQVLAESGAGLVLPPDDPAAAARTLVDHLRDPSWLAAAAGASRRLARERFSRDLLYEAFAGAVLPPVPRGSGLDSADGPDGARGGLVRGAA